MNTQKYVIGIVVAVLLVLGLVFPRGNTVIERVVNTLGASQEHFFNETFHQGMTVGGGIFATSTSGTAVPLLAANFDEEDVIEVTLNVQDATFTLPASTSIPFMREPGMHRTLYIRNATTTATMDITFSGSTGVILKIASSTVAGGGTVLQGDTDGGNYAIIDLVRQSNSDIGMTLTKFID